MNANDKCTTCGIRKMQHVRVHDHRWTDAPLSPWRRCPAGHEWNVNDDSLSEHAKLHNGLGFTWTAIEPPPPPDVFVNVEDYLADVPDSVPWAAEPFAYFGGVTMLAGIWKGGKSEFVAQLARARESAEPFLGRTIPNGPTLYVTEEGGIPVKHKVGDLHALRILDRRTATLHGLTFDGVLASVTAYCKASPTPAVVIVDTWAIWCDVEDENDAVQATAAIGKMTALAQETGAAVVLVHHVRKDGGTHGRGIRGSGALPATVDIFGTLDYADGGGPTDRTLKLEGRVIDPMELHLTYDTDARRYGMLDSGSRAQTEADVWLQDFPLSGDGLTMADVEGRWELSRSPTRRRVDKLLKLGRMRRAVCKARDGKADAWRYWAVLPMPGAPIRMRPTDDEDD